MSQENVNAVKRPNGRIVRYEWFHGPDDALKAAGQVA